MSELITATFEDGVLKPDIPLDLPKGARVRIMLEPVRTAEERLQALRDLQEVKKRYPIDSGGERLTRDQLHERR